MDRCSRIPRRLTSGLEPPVHFPVSHFPVRISADRIMEDREIPAHYSLLSHCAAPRFLIVVGVGHTLHSPHRRRLSAGWLQNSIDMPILRRSEFKQRHGTWLARRQGEEERLRTGIYGAAISEVFHRPRVVRQSHAEGFSSCQLNFIGGLSSILRPLRF